MWEANGRFVIEFRGRHWNRVSADKQKTVKGKTKGKEWKRRIKAEQKIEKKREIVGCSTQVEGKRVSWQQ